MTLHYNKKQLQPRRRQLRNKLTYGEKLIWLNIRRKQICGERFLRQFSVDNFVLDFYCPRLKLAIEIDGPTHFESEEAILKDKERQKHIESFGIDFIRFTDDEVRINIDKVINSLIEKVKELQNKSNLNPPSPSL